MRILQVDANQGAMVSLFLESAGFAVDVEPDGEEALSMAKIYAYDAMTIDTDIALCGSDMGALDLLRHLRAAKVLTPVLMISDRDKSEDRVKALNAGADGYLAKPFDRTELVAQLRALIRRSQGHAQALVSAGELRLDLDQRTVSVGSQRIALTGCEYKMLEILAMRQGKIVTKEALLNHVYHGRDEPEIKIVDVFICKIRRKLQIADQHNLYIETVWGHGYRLCPGDARPVAYVGQNPREKGIRRSDTILIHVLKLIAGADWAFKTLCAETRIEEHLMRGHLSALSKTNFIVNAGSRKLALYRITQKGRDQLGLVAAQAA